MNRIKYFLNDIKYNLYEIKYKFLDWLCGSPDNSIYLDYQQNRYIDDYRDNSNQDDLFNKFSVPVSFGKPSKYIQRITLPYYMEKGEEFTPENAVIILQRKIRRIKEFFCNPLFRVAAQLRIQFHWSGIEVVGSSMEEPNCFIFDIPKKYDHYNPWYLKIISLPSSSMGLKPLYISVDVIYENIVVKFFAFFMRLITIIYIFGFGSLIAFAPVVPAFQEFLLSNLKITADTYIKTTPWVLVLIVFIAFWKPLSDSIASLYTKEDKHLEENVGRPGIKGFSHSFGIIVVDSIPERSDKSALGDQLLNILENIK